MKAAFARRLLLALALLLLAFGATVALLVRWAAGEQEQETVQRMAHGLARHIVGHWPELTSPDGSDRAAREQLLRMLMVVNPAVQVYLLDADGHVSAYIGEPGMVRMPRVDLVPVRAFLAGVPLPLRGTDPMGGAERVFSAAMFDPRPGDSRPPGYLYVVLEGPARAAAAGEVSLRPAWQGVAGAGAIALLAVVLTGAVVLRRLTLPLNRLARRIGDFGIDAGGTQGRAAPFADGARDEIEAIGRSFDAMAARITEQVHAREEQAVAHREVIANVAHDLRTPLTALHGHLEALCAGVNEGDPQRRQRLAAAALSHSDKVRRLSQQLFELATLQSAEHELQRERFRLDELLTDTVQKFELASPRPRVALCGAAPGPIDLEGDLQLIERALTNLIDNAVRHAPGPEPVRVSVQCDGPQVTVLVEDRGPGLPAELSRRLDAGQSVRDPPLRRPGGGIGGLGLAIAQRIAALHGGALRTLPTQAGGGTRLALVLPASTAAGELASAAPSIAEAFPCTASDS